MVNFIQIKDASGVTRSLHTIEDSTSVHFNQSIPTDAQGNVAVVVSGGQHANSNTMGALVVAVRDNVSVGGSVSVHGGQIGVVGAVQSTSIGSGSALIGGVSVRQIVSVQPEGSGNWPVSVANSLTLSLGTNNNNMALTSVGTTPVAQGHGTAANALRVELPTDGTGVVGLNAGVALIGGVSVRQIVSVVWDGANANAPVSVAAGRVSVGGVVSVVWDGANANAPVSVAAGRVSIGGIVSVMWDGANQNAPVSVAAGKVSVNGIVSVVFDGTNLNVPVSGRVSVAGMVTVEPKSNTGSAVPAGAFYVGGADSSSNLRGILTDTDGTQKVGGFVTNAETSFTRPADSTSYTTGDMVANDTNKTALVPMNFPLSRFSGGGGTVLIRRARIVKSTGAITNAQFRLHLYATSNGITNAGVSAATSADNAPYTASKCSAYLGFVSVVMTVSHGDGAVGWGMPNKGMEMSVVLPTAQFNIQGLLEARANYAPGSSERFNVTLEAFQE